MPAKEDKGDAVLAIQFIAGGFCRPIDLQQDKTLWFIKVSG